MKLNILAKKTFLIIGICFFAFTSSAKAQWIVHDPGNAFLKSFSTFIEKIFHAFSIAGQVVTNATLGLPGSGAAARAGLKAGEAPCKVYDRAISIADTADNFATIAVIAGSASEIAKLNTKIQALTVLKECYVSMLLAIDGGTIAAAVAGNQVLSELQQKEEILTMRVLSLNERIDKLRELRTNAVKEMWKAFAVKTLMIAQAKVVTNLVNDTIKKYKISNYTDYAEALTTQVYMVDYINNNVPDGKDQALYRSVIKNRVKGGEILPQANEKAKSALGFEPGDFNVNDETYFMKLASVGASKANPSVVQLEAEWEADMAKQRSARLAEGEINSGGGMISVRTDCQDVTADQANFDRENIRLSAEVQKREEALLSLQTSKALYPKLVGDNQIELAKKAFADAQATLNNFAQRAPGQAFAKVCGPIDNPGKAIGDFTNSYLSAHLNASTNVKNENLPFFARFLESSALNFVDGILKKGKKKNSVLKEKGVEEIVTPSAIIVGTEKDTQILKDAGLQSESSAVVFVGQKNNVGVNGYTLNWNVESIVEASYVVVTGPNNLNQKLELTGSLPVVVPAAGGNYVLRVYDTADQLLKVLIYSAPGSVNPNAIGDLEDGGIDASLDLIEEVGEEVDTGPPIPEIPPELLPDDNPAQNPPPEEGGVQGAFIKNPLILIRGPGIFIRGP